MIYSQVWMYLVKMGFSANLFGSVTLLNPNVSTDFTILATEIPYCTGFSYCMSSRSSRPRMCVKMVFTPASTLEISCCEPCKYSNVLNLFIFYDSTF